MGDVELDLSPETWARMTEAVAQVNQAMRQWAEQSRSAVEQLSLLLAMCNPSGDPDEPLWLDAMRPEPDGEVWNP